MQDDHFRTLVRQARSGDMRALNLLLLELQDELRRIVRMTRRQRAGLSIRSSELFSEAFLKVFRSSCPSFNDQEHLLAMWTNATSWAIIEAWRRKGRRPQLDALVEETVSSRIGQAEVSPEAVGAAFRALREVMPKEGLAAELRLLSGLSTKEVALAMDRSEQTVRRWVQTAGAWIRVHLDCVAEEPAQ